jgi:hypothetical protein
VAVIHNHVKGYREFREQLKLLPTTCPHLEYLRLDNVVLPDVWLLSVLMAMPALEQLELFAVDYKDAWQPEPTPLPVAWPADKDRMRLEAACASSLLHPCPPFPAHQQGVL